MEFGKRKEEEAGMNYRLYVARELDLCVYDRGDRRKVCVRICVGDTLTVVIFS